MSAFHIGVIVYAATFISLGILGLSLAKRRAGSLLPNFFQHRKEIERLLKSGAVSPWDPFHPKGSKRWQIILLSEFVVLAILNLFTE
jgi:hypothetical protein